MMYNYYNNYYDYTCIMYNHNNSSYVTCGCDWHNFNMAMGQKCYIFVKLMKLLFQETP